MREWQSISHVRWYCRYDIIIVPKYRKKVIFGTLRKAIESSWDMRKTSRAMPPLLAQLALQNKKLIYTTLLRLSAETLIEVARNPKFLGAEIGFFSVLHTWTQKLEHSAPLGIWF